MFVCVCTYTALSPDLRGRFQPGGAHFFVFLFWIREENNFLRFTDSFLFYVEFSIFEKFIFDFVLMIGLEFLSQVGSIRKSIKKAIFIKK